MPSTARRVGPRSCIEQRVTSQSIRFGGRFINLVQLSKRGDFNHGYLSRIFTGTRRASVDYLQRIADELGMELSEFRECLKDLKERKHQKHLAQLGLDD